MKTLPFPFPVGISKRPFQPLQQRTPFGAPRRGLGGGLAAHGGGLFGGRVSLHPLGFGAASADDFHRTIHRDGPGHFSVNELYQLTISKR